MKDGLGKKVVDVSGLVSASVDRAINLAIALIRSVEREGGDHFWWYWAHMHGVTLDNLAGTSVLELVGRAMEFLDDFVWADECIFGLVDALLTLVGFDFAASEDEVADLEIARIGAKSVHAFAV